MGLYQPKALRLERFDYRANALSKIFEHVKSTQQFVTVWNKVVKPNIDIACGKYHPKTPQLLQDAEAHTTSKHSTGKRMSEGIDISTPPPLSPPLFDPPEPPPEPAAKKRRVEDSNCMDDRIARKYIGE